MEEFLTGLDLTQVSTPVYIVELEKLRKNLETIKKVELESGATILLALKGFSMYSTFPIIREYLGGTTSSGLNEALLAEEYFGGQTHVYSPAFKADEIEKIAKFAHTIVFNSPSQIERFAPLARKAAAENGNKNLQIGLRVNPEYAEVSTEIYNPCAPRSRLGSLKSAIDFSEILAHIDGLHFHAMCEQNSDVLERILPHFESRFGALISKVKWVNFGGGHHITRPDYDVKKLVSLIKNFYGRYDNLEKIYLEPGEAIALNTGEFVARVLDIHENAGQIAILDASASCHMPDVLEMPYRPKVVGAGQAGEKKYDYLLAGRSCLAGDQIGVYSFDEPLKIGDTLIFTDMAHYTMVKTTTFNGVNLPDIATYDSKTKKLDVVKKFGYEDFKRRI